MLFACDSYNLKRKKSNTKDIDCFYLNFIFFYFNLKANSIEKKLK